MTTNPDRWVDPMPAHVRVDASGTVYECKPCRQIERTKDYSVEGFLALYERFNIRAWNHNMAVHIGRPPKWRDLAPIPAGAVQLSIFDALEATA